jgi:hypothetical protein
MWNATVIRGLAAEVPKLKEQHDLLVMGSGRLVRAPSTLKAGV